MSILLLIIYVFDVCVTGTANVCLQNLRKTLRYGGRKNVPSVEEVTAVSAGRNSKRQLYRLPGGSETVINTKSTTVKIYFSWVLEVLV